MIGRIIIPKYVHIFLIPGTYEYISLHGKKIFLQVWLN